MQPLPAIRFYENHSGSAFFPGQQKSEILSFAVQDSASQLGMIVITRSEIISSALSSQLAMAAARITDHYAAARRKQMLAGKKLDRRENLPERRTRDDAGKVLGVSGKSVDPATKVLASGDKALVADVDAGRRIAIPPLHDSR